MMPGNDANEPGKRQTKRTKAIAYFSRNQPRTYYDGFCDQQPTGHVLKWPHKRTTFGSRFDFIPAFALISMNK